jgi:hypothetical protein
MVVLYRNSSSGVKISQRTSQDKIAQVVGFSTDKHLYQILSVNDAFYQGFPQIKPVRLFW